MAPEEPVATAEQEEAALFERRLRDLTPRTWGTPALIAANILVFAVMVLSGVSPTTPDSETLVAWGADFGPLTTTTEPWRAFTCMFIHIGFIHLALNMWALLAAGFTIERIFGTPSFLVLYVLSGLAGSLASLAWEESNVSAGASGALFGMFGGLGAFLAGRRGAIHGSVASRLWKSVLPTIAYSLFNGFARTGIDNAAHIGGLLSGILLGLVLSRPLEREPAGPMLGRLAAGAGVGAILLASIWVAAPKEWAAYTTGRAELDDRAHAFETAVEDLERRWKKGDIDHREFAGTIESAHLPGLRDAAAALGGTPEWIRQSETDFFEFLDLYVKRWEVYAAGVKELDEGKLDEAIRIEGLMAEILAKEKPPVGENGTEESSENP